jgi:hypothetical protein
MSCWYALVASFFHRTGAGAVDLAHVNPLGLR